MGSFFKYQLRIKADPTLKLFWFLLEDFGRIRFHIHLADATQCRYVDFS